MRTSTLTTIAAAALAAGSIGLLAGCTTSSDEASPTPATTPSSRPAQPLPPAATTDRAPLGLEVRYVDENGRFKTVQPKDFRR